MDPMIDFSSQLKISDTRHWTSDINQLYHPTGKFKLDSEEIVYSYGNINETKFVPILIKEWFAIVKPHGYLVIDYSPNELCDFQKLEEYMWWLWKNKYEIIFHAPISKNQTRKQTSTSIQKFVKEQSSYWSKNLDTVSLLPSSSLTKTKPDKNQVMRFVVKKLKSTRLPDDSIDTWTFGIITNGKRLDWIEEIINSIKVQRIKNYEIIICGTYKKRPEKNIIYIPFNQRDDKGWITKKKNLIIQNSKYENICIVHDRMVLQKDWYSGMKKWGNFFESLGCRQIFADERVNDWIAQTNFIYHGQTEYFSSAVHIEYEDWYPTVWFTGQFYIFKKSVIKKVLLDETVYYGIDEDYRLSKQLYQAGFIHRLNPYSSVKTMTHKYLGPTVARFNSQASMPVVPVDSIQTFIKFGVFNILRTLSLIHIYPDKKLIGKMSNKIYELLLLRSSMKTKFLKESQQINRN
jgi:hypothetical protein